MENVPGCISPHAEVLQLAADAGLRVRGLTWVVNLYFTGGKTTLPTFLAGLAPPLSADICQRCIYMQIAVEVRGAVLPCRLRRSHRSFLCRSRK